MRQDIITERLHPRLFPYSIVSRIPKSAPLRAPFNNPHSNIHPLKSEPTVFENYVHDIFIDNTHVELSLWDTAGQEEFDRLRSLSYDDTHAIMLCFSVDSPDSLENVESKWVGEIADNCPGVKLVLVALKCDLREQEKDEREDGREPKKPTIDYKQGLAVAEKVKALRYLGMFDLWECNGILSSAVEEGIFRLARDIKKQAKLTFLSTECSAMKNRGVNEAFTEAARVALTVKNPKGDKDGSSCSVM